MRAIHHLKKFIVLLGAAIVISTVAISPLRAQDTNAYLAIIAQNTTAILQKVNSIPDYINAMVQFAVNWQAADNTPTTAQMQSDFATLGNLFVQDVNTQNSGQQQLTADLVGQPVSSFISPPNSPSILNLLPNINDIAYSTLLGLPPVPKAPASPYNYIKHAGGINISHPMPGFNWQGKQQDQIKYSNYYATMMAIQSFGGYVMSHQYADYQNGNALTSTQLSLVTQASNSSWIAQIATEELGKVLRQLLMFQSQSYVLLTQLLQTQKQLLTAQVMTNSLLVLSNQNTEILLVAKAQGVKPTP